MADQSEQPDPEIDDWMMQDDILLAGVKASEQFVIDSKALDEAWWTGGLNEWLDATLKREIANAISGARNRRTKNVEGESPTQLDTREAGA